MSMSNKRRRHEQRFGRVTTRPKARGPTRTEVRDAVLVASEHRCEWCGAPANQVQPRCYGAQADERKSMAVLAAWCGTCDPKIGAVSAFGHPSRFASDPPWKKG